MGTCGGLLICSAKQLDNSPFPWITSAVKYIPTWRAEDKHPNENTNLFSFWSWLNILSDLYNYGNQRDFLVLAGGAARETEKRRWVKSNKAEPITQPWRFPWKTSKKKKKKKCFCWCCSNNTTQHKWVQFDLCTSKWTQLKITFFSSSELMEAQRKSKSALMASCVLEGFDYQQGADLSLPLPAGTHFCSPAE